MLTADDGEKIAKKLSATFKNKNRKHKIAIFHVNSKEVGRYGIRRGSGELDHNYIHRQIHVSMAEAEGFSQCRLYFPDFVQILKKNNFYPS